LTALLHIDCSTGAVNRYVRGAKPGTVRRTNLAQYDPKLKENPSGFRNILEEFRATPDKLLADQSKDSKDPKDAA
jgi:hypothetical protein